MFLSILKTCINVKNVIKLKENNRNFYITSKQSVLSVVPIHYFPFKSQRYCNFSTKKTNHLKTYLINEQISHQTILIVNGGENGKHKIVEREDAIALARHAKLDLVMVSSTNDKAICKLFDYEEMIRNSQEIIHKIPKKKDNNLGKKEKEVVFGVTIENNDIHVKIGNIQRFLSKGHPVKISLQWKSRQMDKLPRGIEILKQVMEKIEPYGKQISPTSESSTKLSFVIGPNGKK